MTRRSNKGSSGKGASYNKRSAKTGRFVKKSSEKRRPKTTVRATNSTRFNRSSSGKRSGDGESTTGAGGETREQPKPNLPLLSGGKDSGLAERFEEELHRS